jgi:hypothetical protein
MSRGAVGCDRSKLWATLTDEGGRWRSSGRNQRGSVPLSRRRWIGRRGERSGGGGAVNRRLRGENSKTRDDVE